MGDNELEEKLPKNHLLNYPKPPREAQDQQVYMSYPSAIMVAKRIIKLSHEDRLPSSTISKFMKSIYEENQQGIIS